MPLGRFFRRDKSNDRRAANLPQQEKRERLSMKVMTAQTTPEKVYDLSECGAPMIPDDTYTYCKLLLKTSLNLKDNALTSLDSGGNISDLSAIQHLDVSINKLDNIPDEIGKLSQLRILNISDNKIKTLPSSVAELSNLEELYVSNNRLSRVPKHICALPKLSILALDGNNIKAIGSEIVGLQCSLQNLIVSTDMIKDPEPDIINGGTESIMKYFCSLEGIEYEGIKESESPIILKDDRKPLILPKEDETILNLFAFKRKQQEAQARAEGELQMLERAQLASILSSNTANKDDLLKQLQEVPDGAMDYENQKIEKLKEHIDLIENMNQDEISQLNAYLNNTSHKESLKNDLLVQQQNIDSEVEALVTSREIEHERLLKDLTGSEEETKNALEELVNASSYRKNDQFMSMMQDQENQMEKLLMNIAEEASDLRQKDVASAMQAALLEAVVSEEQRSKAGAQQETWINNILRENQLVNDHIGQVISAKTVDQDAWVSTILEDEQCQAAAFKILLMENDLKRNSIIRQIGYIEYELIRISSLEMRKKKHGVKYGSTTMLEQRSTLVDLLKSLLKEKDDREDELSDYLQSIHGNRENENNEDYWLIQYQRLMSVKPATLIEAEEDLDPKVKDYLEFANSLDLLPVFAQYGLTFTQLMEYGEEEFATMGIGGATYYGIQRSLQQYLLRDKLLPATPSAPSEEEEELENSATAPPIDEEASAPPLEEQFIETECVICLNAACTIIFLPCGHVCSCSSCCSSLTKCPMCRVDIISKMLSNRW